MIILRKSTHFGTNIYGISTFLGTNTTNIIDGQFKGFIPTLDNAFNNPKKKVLNTINRVIAQLP